MGQSNNQTILVIEESATLRYMLGKLVTKMDYGLISVESFESAIALLQENSKNYQGIVLGWPHFEHFEESKHLLLLLDESAYRDIPVVLLAKDAEVGLLHWINSRKLSALVPWENYQEAIDTLQILLTPKEKPAPQKLTSTEGVKPTHVLFVDDSKSIRVVYKKILVDAGYVVLIADSVKAAYEIALREPIDIAIVDYFMPDENGYILCQKLRDNPATADIRTAVLTGTYLDSVIKDCLTAGAVECMFKNEAEELFLARVSSIKRYIEIQRHTERQRENLAAILESVGEGVYGVDKDGRITFFNPAALNVLGVEHSRMLEGLYAHEVFHSVNAEEHANGDRIKQAYDVGEKLKNWETSFRHQTGKEIPVECTVYPLQINGEQEGSVVAFRDISTQKMLEQKLRWQATHDHLTQLSNRRYFEFKLEEELEHVNSSNQESALIYIDLDRFKYINDTIGHDKGDKMLQNLSDVLTKKMRHDDTVARIGGDEFAVILKNTNANNAVDIAEALRVDINSLRVQIEKKTYRAEASIGVAIINSDSQSAGEVLANSDIACHIAKRLGRNQTHLYEASSDERNVMGKELGWSERIRDALDNNGFILHFQPIMQMDSVDVSNLPAQDGELWREYLHNSDGIFHYEVLIRMKGEGGQIFMPDSFLPTAERFNLMLDVDMWVVKNALKELAATGNAGRIQLSINLSGNTLGDVDAYERIKALLEQYEIAPTSIVFEITETSAIENIEHADGFINKFRELGCRFSLDDFGSGFCSFSQLRNLATDFVKIDGQFVKDMARGAMDRAIVTAMNDVAHSLGRSTVAEYVESPEIFRLLKVCGIDRVQGYYISRPLKELPYGNVVKFQVPKQSNLDIN